MFQSKLAKINQPKSGEQGFTLIELLVVIAIIGMLSSVVLASMNTARKKARDARRMTDAKAIQTALELFYDNGNTYPTTAGQVSVVLTALVPSTISKLPTDSTYTGANGYLYGATDPVHGYAVAIQKEQSGWCQFIEGTGYTPWTTVTYPYCTAN